jgi:hypothetical protein
MKKACRPFLLWIIAVSLALAGEPVEQSGKLSEPLEGKTVFEIRGSHNLNGSIKIIPQQGDMVDVSYKKWAEADEKSQARLFLDLIDLKLIPDEDRAVLSILTPSVSPWEGSNYRVSLDIIVQLPEKTQIEGDLHFMKFYAGGPFDGVNINSGFSEIDLQDIKGPIEVATSFAPIRLSGISGSIKAETRYGLIEASDIRVSVGSAIFKNTGDTIRLSDIRGPVEAYNSYSTIMASDIKATEGSVVLRTSYSPIEVEDVSGEIICETSYSPINAADCELTHGQSRFETSYSPINADFDISEDSQLFIYNNYSDINLTIPSDVSSQIVATVDEGGRIHTSDLPVRPTLLDATRLEGFLGDGNGRIELKVSGIGSINIEGR